MRGEIIRAIQRIHSLTANEWETIRVQALAMSVGGYDWDEAWMAASAGHKAGIEAQRRAGECGASSLAAAAVAGAVAAIQAGTQLRAEDFRTLIDPVGDALGRLRQESSGWQGIWRSSRLCPIAAALYG